MNSIQKSSYGRIPAQTIELIQTCVDSARQRLAEALPPSASAEVRSFTVQVVLDVLLKDWRLHDNSSGPDEDDWQDIISFVRLAASLAEPDLNDRGMPIYQATLNGLLSDWLYNWNSDSSEAIGL